MKTGIQFLRICLIKGDNRPLLPIMSTDSQRIVFLFNSLLSGFDSVRLSYLGHGAKATLYLFGHFAKRDAQCFGHTLAVGRVGLQAVAYMPQFDLPGGITHCTSGVGK